MLNYAKYSKSLLKLLLPPPFLIRRLFDCSTAIRIFENIRIVKVNSYTKCTEVYDITEATVF